jgi:ubiquinone biosynthesis protein COQ9
MFMFITYPWPVTSAYAELTGRQPHRAAASRCDATEDIIEQRARHLDEMVRWTGRERLRVQWYRLRLAISAVLRG